MGRACDRCQRKRPGNGDDTSEPKRLPRDRTRATLVHVLGRPSGTMKLLGAAGALLPEHLHEFEHRHLLAGDVDADARLLTKRVIEQISRGMIATSAR